jgi:CRISPR-associated protein Cas5d
VRGFWLEVSGPYACFTRPEMKVERVSYDVITPSAARAIFDAILWKPAIRWQVKKIEVLAPIRWVSVRRNEVKNYASPQNDGIFIEDDRTQRAGLFLRDVKYRLFAAFDFITPDERGKVYNPVPEYLVDADEVEELRKPDVRKDETEEKYTAMFARRAAKGQCFNQPYLGCREFSAAFRLVDRDTETTTPISESRDLGWMFYDWDYTNRADPKAQFFRAQLDKGVINTDRQEVKVRG